MDPPGPYRKTSRATVGANNVRHKRLVKQPSDPESTKASNEKCLGVKDLYSSKSTQDLTRENDEGQFQISNSWLTSTADIIPGTPCLRRFSQSGVAPGSEEYQSVLKDLSPKPESKAKGSKPQVSKNKFRKISFNEFGRASRFAKRLEDMSLSPRPKRSIDMLNAPTISSMNRSVDRSKLENNGKPTQSRRSFPFSGIREAWNDRESSIQDSRSDRRRHVSLPAPPSGFYSENRQLTETLVEPIRPERPARKKSNGGSTPRSVRKISTVVSPCFNMSETSTSMPESHQQVQSATSRKCSTGSLATCTENEHSESTSTRKVSPPQCFTEVKKKQLASAANGLDVHPNLLLGIKNKQAGSNGELPPGLKKQFSAEDTAGEQHVAMKAHKNFRRIGKAALAARRFLRITNNEPGAQRQIPEVSPLAKEERQFDEMVEEMKTSYQDMRLQDNGGKLEKSECSDSSQS